MKLTPEQKAEIIENSQKPAGERRTQTELARAFGVQQPTVCAYIKRWKKKNGGAE